MVVKKAIEFERNMFWKLPKRKKLGVCNFVERFQVSKTQINEIKERYRMNSKNVTPEQEQKF